LKIYHLATLVTWCVFTAAVPGQRRRLDGLVGAVAHPARKNQQPLRHEKHGVREERLLVRKKRGPMLMVAIFGDFRQNPANKLEVFVKKQCYDIFSD
jgi:hypothetical protein